MVSFTKKAVFLHGHYWAQKFYLVGKTPILDSHGIYLLLSRMYFMKPSGLSTFLLFYIKSAKYSVIGV